jgi:hypothetical protein
VRADRAALEQPPAQQRTMTVPARRPVLPEPEGLDRRKAAPIASGRRRRRCCFAMPPTVVDAWGASLLARSCPEDAGSSRVSARARDGS